MHCSFPKCQAHFIVFELSNGTFIIKSFNEEHNHEGEFKQPNSTSLFYRNYLEYFFRSGGSVEYAQSSFMREFEITQNTSAYPFIQCQSDEALRKFAYRIHIDCKRRFSRESFVSLEIIVESIQESDSGDLIHFEYNPDKTKIIFYYAPMEQKTFAHQIETPYHIDATHSIIEKKLQLFFYFIVHPQTEEYIGTVLLEYFKWIYIEPEVFCADCALNIYKAIETFFPSAHVVWCAVHVLRAISRNSDKFRETENFETFYQAMDILTLRCGNNEEASEVYDHLLNILAEEPEAEKYFDKQWRGYKDSWMMIYRGEGDSTNNVSESHFRQIKSQFFNGKKHQRIDDVVSTLITQAIPYYLTRMRVDNVRNDNLIASWKYIKGLFRLKPKKNEHKAIECVRILANILDGIKSRAIDPNIIYPTLKVLEEKVRQEIIVESN